MVCNWGGFPLDLVPSSVPGAGSCSLPLPVVSQLNFGPFPDPREFFCVWGQILSDFKLPPFPKSAFLSAWIFWDSPEPRQPRCSCSSPAVLLLLPPPFPAIFGGKSWIFLSPLALYGAGRSHFSPTALELPELGIFIFPPFYFQPDPVPLGSSPCPSPSRFSGFWWIWEFPVGVTELVRDIFG